MCVCFHFTTTEGHLPWAAMYKAIFQKRIHLLLKYVNSSMKQIHERRFSCGGLWGKGLTLLSHKLHVFPPDSLSGAALKFSSASRPPFTEAATGASVNLGGHSQETEVGGTQAVAEWGWTDNLKESSNSKFLYWKIQGNRYTSAWPTLSKAECNSSDFLLCALEN